MGERRLSSDSRRSFLFPRTARAVRCVYDVGTTRAGSAGDSGVTRALSPQGVQRFREVFSHERAAEPKRCVTDADTESPRGPALGSRGFSNWQVNILFKRRHTRAQAPF
jgi:hypothetical protein